MRLLKRSTLTVSKLVDGRWLELGVHGDDDRVHAEPFEAVQIALGEWWPQGDVAEGP